MSNENRIIPEIPDIQLPDPAAPARKRVGIALAALTGVSALCCAAMLGIGVGVGAISWREAGGVRGINTPIAAQESTPRSIAARVTEILSPSMTATPAPGVEAVKPRATNKYGSDSGATSIPVVTAKPAATPSPQQPEVDNTPAGVAQQPRHTSTPAPIVNVPRDITERQLRVFEDLWKTVETNYYYPDFNGVNWTEVRAQAQARIQQGMTDAAFYDYVGQIVFDLNDNHSSYLSPQAAREDDEQYNGTLEYAGVGIITDSSPDKGYIYVLQVLDNSPAQTAGIRPHDHILSIDGETIIDEKGASLSGRFRGPVGSKVTTVVRSPGKEPREVTLVRERINAKERVEYKLLQNGGKKIGYILIPTLFEDDIDERVRNAIKALTAANTLDGLIVDMRINGGGALDVLRPTLGFFVKGEVGSLTDRKGSRLVIKTRGENIGNSQSVPLAVLVGPATESYAEVFSGALQAKGRAKLIGLSSAGNIETLRPREFEDGSRLWLAEEGFKLTDGRSWEGKGLSPDIVINTPWDEHTEEDDPAIAAAVQALIQ